MKTKQKPFSHFRVRNSCGMKSIWLSNVQISMTRRRRNLKFMKESRGDCQLCAFSISFSNIRALQKTFQRSISQAVHPWYSLKSRLPSLHYLCYIKTRNIFVSSCRCDSDRCHVSSTGKPKQEPSLYENYETFQNKWLEKRESIIITGRQIGRTVRSLISLPLHVAKICVTWEDNLNANSIVRKRKKEQLCNIHLRW